jgi:hypothetical protein
MLTLVIVHLRKANDTIPLTLPTSAKSVGINNASS